MAIQTITAGNDLEVSKRGDPFDVLLEVIDGDEGFLREETASSAISGTRMVPGQSFILEPRKDHSEFLRAFGQDLDVQVTRLTSQKSPSDVRRLSTDSSSGVTTRKLSRRLNHSPGADTDILASDVSPPETGTLMLKLVLASGAVANVQETISGTTIEEDLNSGGALTAGAGYNFNIPCRGDADYNFQVESAVEVDMIQVDYTRQVIF